MFCEGYIPQKINSFASVKSAEDDFNKSISTVSNLLHKLNLYTLSKDVLALSSHRPQEKVRLQMLAEFAISVGQGGIAAMGRRCYRFSYQFSSGSEINCQPYHVCCGSAGQVVSSRDPVHSAFVCVSTPGENHTWNGHCRDENWSRKYFQSVIWMAYKCLLLALKGFFGGGMQYKLKLFLGHFYSDSRRHNKTFCLCFVWTSPTLSISLYTIFCHQATTDVVLTSATNWYILLNRVQSKAEC